MLASKPMRLQELTHELQGGCFVAPGLGQDVSDLALTVGGSPAKHASALDRDHDLIQVPGPVGRSLSRRSLRAKTGSDWKPYRWTVYRGTPKPRAANRYSTSPQLIEKHR